MFGPDWSDPKLLHEAMEYTNWLDDMGLNETIYFVLDSFSWHKGAMIEPIPDEELEALLRNRKND